jgi:uncharacterized glyoxalase superfamily protein PhnB
MTTLNQEFDRLAQSVNQTLSIHQQQLHLQQEQIKSLTQLLHSSRTSSDLDAHCLSAIERLTILLDRHHQENERVCEVLDRTLTQAKDAQNLTVDASGEAATTLKLELAELAQRLGVDRLKLSAASHAVTKWSKMMAASPDPDGYQWQFPSSKRGLGFYHQTRLQIVGTKTVSLAVGTSLN